MTGSAVASPRVGDEARDRVDALGVAVAKLEARVGSQAVEFNSRLSSLSDVSRKVAETQRRYSIRGDELQADVQALRHLLHDGCLRSPNRSCSSSSHAEGSPSSDRSPATAMIQKQDKLPSKYGDAAVREAYPIKAPKSWDMLLKEDPLCRSDKSWAVSSEPEPEGYHDSPPKSKPPIATGAQTLPTAANLGSAPTASASRPPRPPHSCDSQLGIDGSGSNVGGPPPQVGDQVAECSRTPFSQAQALGDAVTHAWVLQQIRNVANDFELLTDCVAASAKSVTALEDNVDSSLEFRRASDSKLGNLERHVLRIAEACAASEQSVGGIARRIRSFEDAFMSAQSEPRIAGMEGRIAEISEIVVSSGPRVADTERRLAGVEEVINSVLSRMPNTNNEHDVAILAEHLTGVQLRADRLEALCEEGHAKMLTVCGRFEELDRKSSFGAAVGERTVSCSSQPQGDCVPSHVVQRIDHLEALCEEGHAKMLTVCGRFEELDRKSAFGAAVGERTFSCSPQPQGDCVLSHVVQRIDHLEALCEEGHAKMKTVCGRFEELDRKSPFGAALGERTVSCSPQPQGDGVPSHVVQRIDRLEAVSRDMYGQFAATSAQLEEFHRRLNEQPLYSDLARSYSNRDDEVVKSLKRRLDAAECANLTTTEQLVTLARQVAAHQMTAPMGLRSSPR